MNETFEGFTAEERVAMNERVRELKAAARPGSPEDRTDGESAVLAKIGKCRNWTKAPCGRPRSL